MRNAKKLDDVFQEYLRYIHRKLSNAPSKGKFSDEERSLFRRSFSTKLRLGIGNYKL
ncbi:MAG: hypothetical protein KME30_13260 [Iphinoe sp. HA4291-MV1]|nr:hypothetical protein [Iphinoe sp. HA4291-MV1]